MIMEDFWLKKAFEKDNNQMEIKSRTFVLNFLA